MCPQEIETQDARSGEDQTGKSMCMTRTNLSFWQAAENQPYPTSMEESGVHKNCGSYGLHPYQMLLTGSLVLLLLPSPKEKLAYFHFSPGNRNWNPRGNVRVKCPWNYKAGFELNITDHIIPLFWHIPNIRVSWNHLGIRNSKTTGTYHLGPDKDGGEGEFHQGIYA